jgi:predicted ATPase
MSPVRRDLPTGTVTFLFTDVEGSTKLLHELGAEAYALALAEHRRLLREAFARHRGVEVDTQGDAFFYAFPTGPDAVEAASEGQSALSKDAVRVRVGIHTGTPHVTEEGYVGADVHKAARIAAAGHGGQVLLSKETRELVQAEVHDLGEHRLKDFDDPVWIFQLGSSRFPPLKTISNTNLPRPVSSFIGRQREVDEVVAQLQNGARLLTLTGPGGSGKTRLAIEAAAELVPEFRNGVFWVGLATLHDPGLVLETVAETLGARDGLGDHVGQRELLLLLDNFEQVVEAAPELSSLLTACPNMRLLVTSRELLRVQGEVEYAVPPLSQREAVQLFCTRSGLEIDESIAELCRRLDDLPLAVELAAARTKVLSPTQILERISKRLDLLKGGRDAYPRQATLRATIEWSYDLLSDEEKALFARLAVFAGGSTLESAEEVAGADIDTLQALVEKSLLRYTDDRFWMLETIREYAAERLEESGEAGELLRRHAEHFLALAEEAEPYVRGSSPGMWLERLELEHDNIRLALDHLQSLGEAELAMRFAGSLDEFWCPRGHVAEGIRRLEAALAGGEASPSARAKVLNALSHLTRDVGDADSARRYGEQALTLYGALHDRRGVADAMIVLGSALADEGDLGKARELYAESAKVFEQIGDEHMSLFAKRMLAWMHNDLGDRKRAIELHSENLNHARKLGNNAIVATTLSALASYAVDEGRGQEAMPMLREAYELHREEGNLSGAAVDVYRFAGALAAVSKAEAAARVLSCAHAIDEELGVQVPPYLAEENKRTLLTIKAKLDDGALAAAWEQGQTMTADAAVAVALEALSPGARHK